jgi:hypothetical protein
METYCASCEVRTQFIHVMYKKVDRLCALVVRVPGYTTEMYCASCEVMLCRRSRPPLWSSGQGYWLQIQRPGFNSRGYQIFWEVVGLERGPLILMSTSSGSGLKGGEYGRGDPSRWSRGTPLYPQKLALTLPTSGGSSVGIVRLYILYILNVICTSFNDLRIPCKNGTRITEIRNDIRYVNTKNLNMHINEGVLVYWT